MNPRWIAFQVAGVWAMVGALLPGIVVKAVCVLLFMFSIWSAFDEKN